MLSVVILAVGIFSSVLIGWFVFTRDPRQQLNQLYGLLTLSFISLTVFNHLTLIQSPYLLLFMRAVIFSTTIASAALLFLILNIRYGQRRKLPPFLAYSLIGFTAIVGVLELSPVVFIELNKGTSPTPVPGWGVVPFIAHFIIFIVACVIVLFSGARHTRAKERKRFVTMQIGIAPILILAPLTSVILPVFLHNTAFVMFSPLYLVFFLAMVGYAIVRHGLFDIRLAVIRTVAYALSLATLSLVYFLFAYLASATLFKEGTSSEISFSPVNVVLALVLAFIFQPVKQFFDKTTDKIFYKDRYNIDEFIARLSGVLTTTTDLKNLLHRAAREIGTTLKADQAFFTVTYNHTHQVSAGTDGHEVFSKSDIAALSAHTKDSMERVVVTDMLRDEDPIERLLRDKHVAILMPLSRENTTFGYLALGEQRSSGYTSRDVKLLSTVADELVIAIQNSLSVEEVRDINIHLQQRINEATIELRHSNRKLKKLDTSKDEFISMASHQLRTPLTSVKGYLSMVLEGDVGKISSAQRKVLEEAFNSSQRMVYLISDFLNVSRLQTGKFELETSDVKLPELITDELAQLQASARARKVTLIYDPPATFPTLSVDENKIRQVMMNFIDNAIYYAQPDGGTITVTLSKHASHITFRVIDNGIGVPKSEQKQLFTKFYRASNARQARPDGTGIGLFMAKKVIVAHGGAIIFETKEGVGSTFGFRLPLEDQAK